MYLNIKILCLSVLTKYLHGVHHRYGLRQVGLDLAAVLPAVVDVHV